MKKFFIICLTSVFCFGCGKKEEVININIYDNRAEEKEIIENNEEIIIEKEIVKDVDVDNKEEREKENNLLEEDISSTSKIKDKIYDVYDKAKDWYDDNKDEIKETAKEQFEDDKETTKELIDKAKDKTTEIKDRVSNWYEGSELKQSIDQDIESTKDLYNKIKNNE